MTKLTLNVPDEVLEALRELHARTYPTHRLKFSPWLVSHWARVLSMKRKPIGEQTK